MKQKASPVAITVAVVGLLVLLGVMYRTFFPPSPPRDVDNPNGMPAYARDFLKNRKAMRPPGGPAGTPQAGSTTPGR